MLLDYEKMKAIKPISGNNKAKFEIISQEVEDQYLPAYLNDAFAYDIQQNPTSYQELLEGVEYDTLSGVKVKFKGLLYVLAYLCYPAYLEETKYADTYTGFVTKNRDEANTITQGQEERLKNKFKSYAEREVDVMYDYLNRNSATYPLWNCLPTTRPYNPKIINVRKI